MNISFERSENRTDEWYTPKNIIDALGPFDLDPCAPVTGTRPYDFARFHYDKNIDGLSKEWFGRVWCNPPYSQPSLRLFIEKMAQHANGIALIFNRMDNSLWHDVIFPTADAILIIRGRIKFLKEGVKGNHQAGCGSVLIAWGKVNAECLRTCNIPGKYFNLKQQES